MNASHYGDVYFPHISLLGLHAISPCEIQLVMYSHPLCLAAFLGDIALDEEDLRLLKANYMDAKENDSSNLSIPDSGEYGCCYYAMIFSAG